MAITKAYTLYSPSYAATVLTATQNSRVSTGLARRLIAGDGAIAPTFGAVVGVEASIEFETLDIEDALGVIETAGARHGKMFARITAASLFKAHLQKLAQGASRATGAVHQEIEINEGLLYLDSISADQESARARYIATAIYDGTNDPLALTDSVSLPGSPAVTQPFATGPAEIEGTMLDSVASFTLTTNARVVRRRSDGSALPTFGTVDFQTPPSVTIQTYDASILSALDSKGTPIAALNPVKIWLRALQHGTTPFADASLEHLLFTINKGVISVEETGGDQDGDSMATIRIDAVDDLTNDLVAVSTGVAIS